MLKRLRDRHPMAYCVFSEGLFFVIMLLESTLLAFGLVAAGVDVMQLDDYMLSAIQEMVGVAVALLLLWRTGRLGVLRQRGAGFFGGLLVGMYPLVIIGYNLAFRLMMLPVGQPMRPAGLIAWFLLCFVLVGAAEELLFRGVIAQTLLEHYGTSRSGVWKACLISGVLFGAGHLTNLFSSAPFGVLMQCAFSFALGCLLAAIYFRSGNIWVPIFLHALMDITSMLYGGLYNTQSVSEAVSSYDASMLLSVLIYMIPTIFLLRKKKIREVALYFGEDGKKMAR